MELNKTCVLFNPISKLVLKITVVSLRTSNRLVFAKTRNILQYTDSRNSFNILPDRLMVGLRFLVPAI
jgi:hypothetical protein